MSETPPTPVTYNSAPLLNKSRLVDQTSGGPTLHDAGAQLLHSALKKVFPGQDIDPDTAFLATPVWSQKDEEFVSQRTHYESLTHTLVRLAITKTVANYIEGEHFLTLTRHTSEPIHLPVSMDTLTVLLNEHASSLFVAFAQSQLDYWNELVDQLPRWRSLADTLQNALDVHSVVGWNTDQCTLARLVAQYPEKAQRPAASSGLTNIRACLLDLDLAFEMAESSYTEHLMLPGALVLTATSSERELVVMYTISEGYESFDSLEQLSATLPERIDIDLRGRTLEWRLYEPEGNIFDATVWALVNCQLDSIDALDPASRSVLARMNLRQEVPGGVIDSRDNARIEQLIRAVPEWLLAGSIDDVQAYSRYLTDLGALRDEADRDVFKVDDLPLIQIYAQQKMCSAIVADYPREQASTLNNIRISITHSFEVGGFTLPDPNNSSVETLGEFALQNTQPYIATVAYADGTAAPSWMTTAYLLRIANQINIGETYPKLIKDTLIDNPEQARRHKIRFCRQLPLLLPLLALECKLKRQGAVDEQGYRLVCQLMEAIKNPLLTESSVQIRPLAFMPRHRLGSTPDTVANMYIIGPCADQTGPCLLYRPLLEQPLRQFSSEQNMLYALYQPGELRDSILAWLPTRAVSFDYAQYVFSTGIPSLWNITDLVSAPLSNFDLAASVDLANTPLRGDILATLFTQNSQAMAELADRKSTSNAERRWALLADSGWAVFSVAANFLSGPAGTAVWVWQSISQLQQALDAHERGDTIVQWSSVGDVLLTLGILLTQRAAMRRTRIPTPSGKKRLQESLSLDEPVLAMQIPETTAIVAHDPTPLSAKLPGFHLSNLAPAPLSRIKAGAQFVQQIDQLQVPEPMLPEGARPNADHLYPIAGKFYAKVGARWFEVSAGTDEPVSIIDPKDPLRPGLTVKYDTSEGYWHWDLKLRLRGGSPTGRIEALRRARIKRKDDAWIVLRRFIEREATLKNTMDEALKNLPKTDVSTPDSDAAELAYANTAQELTTAYGQALDELVLWHEAGGEGAFYQSLLMRFSVEQHRYANGWLRMKLREYAKTAAPLITQPGDAITIPRSEQLKVAQKAIDISDEMREGLDRLHASLDRLMGSTGATRKVGSDLRKLLPGFTVLDLEANEVGLSPELVLGTPPGKNTEQVRELVTKVFDNAADACHELIERRNTVKNPEKQPLNVEQLTDLVDRFADIERHLQTLLIAWPKYLEPTRFKRVQALVEMFHQVARKRLLELLPAPEEHANAPLAVKSEPVPSTSRTVGKVTKTRPRDAAVEKAPSLEKTDATNDVPVLKIAARRSEKAPVLDDTDLIANALELNADADKFISSNRAEARRKARIPADIKDLFDIQVARLEQAAKDTDAAIARAKAAGLTPMPVAMLSAELRANAAKTRREGIAVYGAMLMKRKPREAYLKWLSENHQVDIVKDERGRINTRQRKDYFQEYRIFDRAHPEKALWVAHFHYDTLNDQADNFTVAHLKFADAYLQDQPEKARLELETFDSVDNALRRIVSPAVRDLFLKAQPTASAQP